MLLFKRGALPATWPIMNFTAVFVTRSPSDRTDHCFCSTLLRRTVFGRSTKLRMKTEYFVSYYSECGLFSFVLLGTVEVLPPVASSATFSGTFLPLNSLAKCKQHDQAMVLNLSNKTYKITLQIQPYNCISATFNLFYFLSIYIYILSQLALFSSSSLI